MLPSSFRLIREILHSKLYSTPSKCCSAIWNHSNGFSTEVDVKALTPSKETNHGKREPGVSPDIRFIYPEFLPDPKMEWRNSIREKLERKDMLQRRKNIRIPEFYVGSVLAVTSSNPHAPSKTSRFVGLCIQRTGCGLRANFMLRNIVDGQGIEVIYSLYDPTIQTIEVLRLEKRLDESMLYLRDALPEYSTFPFDMEPEFLPEGEAVPVNPIKVKLKPQPWRVRHELRNHKGVQDFEVSEKRWKHKLKTYKPYVKWDLMKQYRETIPEEEQREIYAEVYSELQKLEITRKKLRRVKQFIPPKKTG